MSATPPYICGSQLTNLTAIGFIYAQHTLYTLLVLRSVSRTPAGVSFQDPFSSPGYQFWPNIGHFQKNEIYRQELLCTLFSTICNRTIWKHKLGRTMSAIVHTTRGLGIGRTADIIITHVTQTHNQWCTIWTNCKIKGIFWIKPNFNPYKHPVIRLVSWTYSISRVYSQNDQIESIKQLCIEAENKVKIIQPSITFLMIDP